MAAPYSDNLYSGNVSDTDDEEGNVLSPSDGYFHASSSSDLASAAPQSQADTTSSSANVPVVPNVLVEDPTLREQSIDKAREAEQDRLNEQMQSQNEALNHNNTAAASRPRPSSQRPSFAPVHYHRRSVDEDDDSQIHTIVDHTPSPRTPSTRVVTDPLLLHQQRQSQLRRPAAADAPPAYSPTISPVANADNANPGYNTFGPSPANMGLPEERDRLLPRDREPQSMGGPHDQPKRTQWQHFKDRFHVPNLRKKIKTALGVFVILSIFLMVLSGFTLHPEHKHPDIGKDDPVREPDGDGPPDFKWSPTRQCLNEPYVFDKVITNVEAHHERSLTVIHNITHEDRRNGWNPHVYGEVYLQPADESSPATITLEAISNSKDLNAKVSIDKENQVYIVSTPDKIAWSHGQAAPCIQVRVTVAVPRHSWFKSLKVQTVQLDISIREGLTVGIVEGSNLSTLSGNIRTPSPHNEKDDLQPYLLGSRDVVIETVSGDVKGWFPLYDLLKVTTMSGNVAIGIDPKKADPTLAKSADLNITTISGTIQVSEPIERAIASTKPDKIFPPRDYTVYINSASGDVEAKLAISSSANFQSVSGDFNLTLWPILDSALLLQRVSAPKLTTETRSGQTTLALLEPLWTSVYRNKDSPSDPSSHSGKPWPPAWDEGDFSPIEGTKPSLVILPDDDVAEHKDVAVLDSAALASLKSKHNSISGDIKLNYPSAWVGSLWAQTISGSQDVHGEGLELSRSGGTVIHIIHGRKGRAGTSELKVDTVSGDQTIIIGN